MGGLISGAAVIPPATCPGGRQYEPAPANDVGLEPEIRNTTVVMQGSIQEWHAASFACSEPSPSMQQLAICASAC